MLGCKEKRLRVVLPYDSSSLSKASILISSLYCVAYMSSFSFYFVALPEAEFPRVVLPLGGV
jgi:hypothetical protein